MATATKKNSKPVEPATAADSLIRLPGANIPEQQLAILDFIRYRDAGLRVPFDSWMSLSGKLWANDKAGSPSQVLARYADAVGLDELSQLELLIGYVDNLNTIVPVESFADFLHEAFPEVTDGPAAVASEDGTTAVQTTPWGEETAANPESEPEPEPEPEKPKKVPRSRPGAKKEETSSAPAEAGWEGRRVVYKTKSKKVIYGVCTVDQGQTINFINNDGSVSTNVGKGLVKFDDGPVVFTITKEQAAQIKKMTAPNRGLWPGKAEHDPLFELSRRVVVDKLLVITVHNAKPQPFIDAFVYAENTAEGENDTPYECEPRDDIVGEYKFEVEGLGVLPARVVVQ